MLYIQAIRPSPKPRLLRSGTQTAALWDRGLLDAFDDSMLEQLDGIRGPAQDSDSAIRDLRGLPWCSIDNDESKDLDKLTVALDPAANEDILNFLFAVAAPSISLRFSEAEGNLLG